MSVPTVSQLTMRERASVFATLRDARPLHALVTRVARVNSDLIFGTADERGLHFSYVGRSGGAAGGILVPRRALLEFRFEPDGFAWPIMTSALREALSLRSKDHPLTICVPGVIARSLSASGTDESSGRRYFVAPQIHFFAVDPLLPQRFDSLVSVALRQYDSTPPGPPPAGDAIERPLAGPFRVHAPALAQIAKLPRRPEKLVDLVVTEDGVLYTCERGMTERRLHFGDLVKGGEQPIDARPRRAPPLVSIPGVTDTPLDLLSSSSSRSAPPPAPNTAPPPPPPPPLRQSLRESQCADPVEHLWGRLARKRAREPVISLRRTRARKSRTSSSDLDPVPLLLGEGAPESAIGAARAYFYPPPPPQPKAKQKSTARSKRPAETRRKRSAPAIEPPDEMDLIAALSQRVLYVAVITAACMCQIVPTKQPPGTEVYASLFAGRIEIRYVYKSGETLDMCARLDLAATEVARRRAGLEVAGEVGTEADLLQQVDESAESITDVEFREDGSIVPADLPDLDTILGQDVDVDGDVSMRDAQSDFDLDGFIASVLGE